MSTTKYVLSLAVGTLVLAASAVSAPSCPLGPQISVERPVLPWAQSSSRVSLASKVRSPPRLTLRTIVGGDGAVLVRTLSKIEMACGSGRGELTVRIERGVATATVTGLDLIATSCITRAIEQGRFTRIANGTLARLAIELH